jgi:Domain of unknown function (DUF3806)
VKPEFFMQFFIAAVLSLGMSLPIEANDDIQISELSALDMHYMEEQRNTVNELAGRNFGGRISGETTQDLRLLQRLLDQNLVRNDQTQQLQAMGIVLGDLLAQDLDMHWVVYQDKLGRSRALRYRQSDDYLFPATMISRRREADNRKSVEDIYRKAYDIINARRPKRPYQ